MSASVLIPNETGLNLALKHRDKFQEINGFLSASETHNQKNVGRSVAESLADLASDIRARAVGGPAVRGRDLDVLRLPLRGPCAGRPCARDRPGAGGGGR